MHLARRAAVFLTALLLSSCSGGSSGVSPVASTATADPAQMKIAYLEDLSVENPSSRVTPAFQGMRLAFTQAAESGALAGAPQIVGYEVGADPSKAVDVANQIASDPAFVAVAIAPFLAETPDVGQVLRDAGLPTFDLSPLGPTLGSGGGWWRVVANENRQVGALLSQIGTSRRVCVIGDGTPYALVLSERLRTPLAGRAVLDTTMSAGNDPSATVAKISSAACGVVMWTGFGEGAGTLRFAMTEAGLGNVKLVGSDATKDESFLSVALTAGEGTVVTCPCVDLSTSTVIEDQRFIHDYQSATATAPGVYSVEGYDVGNLLLQRFQAGAATRVALSASLGKAPSFDGLAATYRFGGDGELAAGSAHVDLFVDQGLSWVPLGDAGGRVQLPVGTPGKLSVASCHRGAPFVYRRHGSLTGFDVELARAIADRLGLRLIWQNLDCAEGMKALAAGHLDALMTPAAPLPQSTPMSRVYLSLHGVLVTTAKRASASDPVKTLAAGDVVGVLRSRATSAWVKRTLGPAGVRTRSFGDPARAYDLLASGGLAGVVDLEPDAWLQIENRPSLRVAMSADIGDHDVIIAGGPDTVLLGAVDEALGGLLDSGTYTKLFAKYFPGTTVPAETGS
jgi:branched-chain amino acid transport system substrate-binding protein